MEPAVEDGQSGPALRRAQRLEGLRQVAGQFLGQVGHRGGAVLGRQPHRHLAQRARTLQRVRWCGEQGAHRVVQHGLADHRRVPAVVTGHGERPPHSVRIGLSTTPDVQCATSGEEGTPAPRARFNTFGDGSPATLGPEARGGAHPDLRCPWGYRCAKSGSGSSTLHPSSALPSSVVTRTAELAAPVTHSRVIDQLTQLADSSRTASQQAPATGSAPVQKRPAHRRRSTRIHGELHGPSDRLVQQVVNVCSATNRWEGVCAAPVFVLAVPARPVGQREPS